MPSSLETSQSFFTKAQFLCFWMTRQGHLPMVIQLIRYGADPSIADGEGYRALHLAILFQHMAIAAYLMAKGQVGAPDTLEMSYLAQRHPFFVFLLLCFDFCRSPSRKSTALTAMDRRL